MVRRRAAPSPDDAAHRRKNHEVRLRPHPSRRGLRPLLRMREVPSQSRHEFLRVAPYTRSEIADDAVSLFRLRSTARSFMFLSAPRATSPRRTERSTTFLI